MQYGEVATFLLLSLGIAVIGHAMYSYLRAPDFRRAGPFGATWRPAESVSVTVAIYFVSQLAVGVLLGIYYLATGTVDMQAITAHSVLGNFVAVLLFELMTVFLLVAFLQRRKATRESIGFIRPRWSDLVYSLAGYGVYFILFLMAIVIIKALLPGVDLDQPQELGFDPGTTGPALILVFMSLVILPPIVEEIVCRGFLYAGLRSQLPLITSVLITNVVFAAAHLQAGSGNPLLWIAAVDTFILSTVLIYLREKTGGLAAPIGLHALKNALAFTLLFIVPLPVPGL